MAAWGPIQLRLKGSRQVEFDGEASPAPGGGSTPQYEVLSGNPVSIGNTNVDPLTVDTKGDGTDLLDLTTPDNPLFLVAGLVVVTVTLAVDGNDSMTVGGWFQGTIAIGNLNPYVSGASQIASATQPNPQCPLTLAAAVAVGDRLRLSVQNNDGVATRGFVVQNLVIAQ